MADERPPQTPSGTNLSVGVEFSQGSNQPPDAEEARFRRRARAATLGVTLFLVVAEVLGDVGSGLFGIGNFHANEAIVGTLFGGSLLIGGITILPKIGGSGGLKR